MSINKNLTEYLIRLNSQQYSQQALRQTIARNPFFQCLSVFERFDKFRKGDLIPSDFSEFMLQNHFYPTESELYIIFRDFDIQRIGVVTLQAFQAQILPRQDSRLRLQAQNKKPYPSQSRLSIDLEFLLRKYFQAKIIAHRQLQVIRIRMQQVKNYFAQQSFLLLDSNNVGFLSKIEQIDRFLRRNGHALQLQDLLRIYRVLNFNRVEQITFDSFQSHLNPFCKGFYENYKLRMIQKERTRQILAQKQQKLDMQILYRSRNKMQLSENIVNLVESNRRLSSVIKQQNLSLALSRQALQQNQAILKVQYVSKFL